MAALEEIVKNAEEIAIREDGEDIIEEVIEEEQVDWMGPQEVMEQVQGEYYNELLEQHQLVEYAEDPEGYQPFLPVRNGEPYFQLNLPDLLSKSHQFTQDSGAIVRLVSCFNKKCQRQVACNGYLYTIKEFVSDTQWNNWRCINDQCYGEIRTTPDFTEVREVNGHTDTCPEPDELQLNIRIAVYDARLLAEFTDTPLIAIHTAAVERMKADCPEGVLLFPPFEVLKETLEDHRHNKVYRKRFEMQEFRDKQRKMNMTADEVLFNENNSNGAMKFRRTKPFPPSFCGDCPEQIYSTNLPSQDQLIAHYLYSHERRLTIERFEFKDFNLFEQYIRELNVQSRYKMKKMGFADENMYYLCNHDDRLAKNGVGRASRLQPQNCHCTAFIRVFDFRDSQIVSKREGARVTIDYCLEHQRHSYEPEYPSRQGANTTNFGKEYIDYYTPEYFLQDLEERRIRSQKLMLGEVTLAGHAERTTPTKRTLEAKTYLPPARLKASFGARSLAPPLAAQLAAGSSQPYVDAYGEMESPTRHRSKLRQPIRNYQKSPEPDTENSEQQSTSVEDVALPPPRIYITQKPFTRMTERQNFKDIYTFNAVCKVEDTCLNLLNRLQSCQHAHVGLGYREKIASILRNANSDPGLVDGSTKEEIQLSWVLQKPLRGRPRKRARLEEEEGGEEIEEGDDDEEEIDMGDVQEVPAEEPDKDDDKIVQLTPPKKSSTPEMPEMAVEAPEAPEMPEMPETIPNVERSDSSTSSQTSQDVTTRSGRSRKLPARLLEI